MVMHLDSFHSMIEGQVPLGRWGDWPSTIIEIIKPDIKELGL